MAELRLVSEEIERSDFKACFDFITKNISYNYVTNSQQMSAFSHFKLNKYTKYYIFNNFIFPIILFFKYNDLLNRITRIQL